MASLQIHQATIAAVADRIVLARQLHGKDSSYAIGLFTGIELLVGEDGEVSKQIQKRVLELEDGQTPTQAPKKPAAVPSELRAPESEEGQTAAADLAENTWIRGAVKWFNNDKGYGFISTDANTDVFVHWRDISSWDRSLTQGDPVEFMVTKTAKGFQAINVMKPDAAGGDEAGDSATGEASEVTATTVPMPPPDMVTASATSIAAPVSSSESTSSESSAPGVETDPGAAGDPTADVSDVDATQRETSPQVDPANQADPVMPGNTDESQI